MAIKLFSTAASLTFPSHLLHRPIINPRKTCYTLTVQMSWACKKCTFVNPPTPSQKPTCQICLSPSSSSPPPSPASSSIPKWSCKACTFLNAYKNSNCEVCDTRASISSLSSFEDLTDTGLDGGDLDSSVGSVFLPLQRCKRKRVEDAVEVNQGSSSFNVVREVKSSDKRTSVSGSSNFNVSGGVEVPDKGMNVSEGTSFGSSGVGLTTLKILSYNVWFREDLEVHKRMKALGDLIQQHCPDLICFQEVTPNIYDIFRQSSWWKMYQSSVSNQMADSRPYFCMQLSKLRVKSFSCKPFGYSAMGRELCVAEVEVPGDKHLVVATSHLESPCPGPPNWDQMYSKERVDQAKEALNLLNKNQNVIFCGDMNWDDKLDGQFPLPNKWIDAWEELRPEENGWTYDTKSNMMLSGNRKLQKRLDRFLCSLHDFRVSKIEMIGMDAIPGLSYIKEKKVRTEIKKLELPVLPSDHYGLLLTICSQ
ncbi:hypothetical protein PRUPE_4G019000 [Prunus persica]|uniref:RanBP2-type domain-containing protein n=1 Tax=Prunus persica TaxID=3760 RepID=A0A251PED5_PRUPE|nr:uncharacterized protein LOC18779101 isoform X2 [Prunus persica]ONI09927.1 hypothetical protein PRUPE_4G019000 [Prunus persica]